MFNRPNRNDINDDAQDIRNDVSQLADTLEEVLKSWGSDAKDEADAAKRKAQSLLRETRARMNGRSRATQAACDMASCATTFVRENRSVLWERSRRSASSSAPCSACVNNAYSAPVASGAGAFYAR
jgi:ElaB/YqjD/DUF883 family membrane-anchored ribosome-binding protein